MEPRRSSRLKTRTSAEAAPSRQVAPKAESPSRKRARTAAPAPSRSKARKPVKGRVSGGKAQLSAIPRMPLDVLFEIFSHLLPLDLLHLARSTKALRRMLMARSAAFIWRDALANHPDALPRCADGLSEPQFTHMLFDHYCGYCGSPYGQDVLWAYFLRLCGKCTKANFVKPPARMILNENIIYARLFGTRGGSYGSCFASKSEMATVRKMHSKLKGEALETYKNEHRELVTARLEFDKVCVEWYLAQMRKKEREFANMRQQRQDEISTRLMGLGWDEELNTIDIAFQWRQLWAELVYATLGEPLTDRLWEDMMPKLVEILQGCREYLRQQERSELLRGRISALERAFRTLKKIERMDDLYLLNIPDIANMQPFRDKILNSARGDVTYETLEPLVAQLPKLVLEWKKANIRLLLGLLPSSEQQQLADLDESPLRLATTFFRCISCTEPISFPRVLEHACLTHCDLTDDTLSIEDELMFACTRRQRRNPWNYKGDELSFDTEASNFSKAIIGSCGQDPATVTAATMDGLNPRVECLLCVHQKRGRLVMRWKIAILHDLKEHIDVAEPHWRLISQSDCAAVEIQEARSVAKARKDPDYYCKRCGRALHKSDMHEHLNMHPGDSLEETFLPKHDISMRQPPYAVRIR